MSVPLDRLYNHLDGLCNHDVLIYRFFPHGSKNLQDLKPLQDIDWVMRCVKPVMICHDQEPLDFHAYSQDYFFSLLSWLPNEKVRQQLSYTHLRAATLSATNAYDKMLLSHSEINSPQITKFRKHGFCTVYWWSHAAIARDWFRHAELDPDLAVDFCKIKTDFLIYNRAWSGSREYRLKFAELLIENDLVQHANTSFASTCNDLHYSDHKFANSDLRVHRKDIADHFVKNMYPSSASADYDRTDYSTSGIEVVLETVFDDVRLHLTEKCLRPIACGRPFILLSSPNSLDYLRSYGFKTFDGIINENYDKICDPVQRMQAVIKEMQRLAALDSSSKLELWRKLYHIAQQNKKLFFSKSWLQSIFDEFQNNVCTELPHIYDSKSGRWLHALSPAKAIDGFRTTEEVTKVFDWLHSTKKKF